MIADFCLLYRLKIYGTMLAQRADDILGELVALVDVAANLADEAFFCPRSRASA